KKEALINGSFFLVFAVYFINKSDYVVMSNLCNVTVIVVPTSISLLTLISFNSKPLRMMIYLGLFIFSISVLYIIYLFINIMISGVNIPGYFSTIAAILLLGGIQLISIGVVGEYIGRIYYEVKARPKYIIQATNLSSIENDEKDTHKVYSK
ncbi:TPA: hypothetical protein ACH98I_002834, partial [Staphylococcus aureus]